jgi:hypothetical protein
MRIPRWLPLITGLAATTCDTGKHGWYLDAGGTFHYGVSAGLTLGGAELAARFGFGRTEDFNDVAPPMYGVFTLRSTGEPRGAGLSS